MNYFKFKTMSLYWHNIIKELLITPQKIKANDDCIGRS